MAFRKSIKASEIKEGDDIVVYYHSGPAAKAVKPLYFHVNEINFIHGETRLGCIRVKKDGRIFRDRWHETQEVDFTLDKKHDILTTRSYYGFYSLYDSGTFYLDPDIPCGLVINKLMEEKRRINKTIIECQHLMYSVEHDV